MKIYGVNDNWGAMPELEAVEVAKETDKTYCTKERAKGLGYNNVHKKDAVSLTPKDAWEKFIVWKKVERHRMHENIAKHDRAIEEAERQLAALEVARG